MTEAATSTLSITSVSLLSFEKKQTFHLISLFTVLSCSFGLIQCMWTRNISKYENIAATPYAIEKCLLFLFLFFFAETKNQWARDDPAFVVICSLLLAVATLAYCAA